MRQLKGVKVTKLTNRYPIDSINDLVNNLPVKIRNYCKAIKVASLQDFDLKYGDMNRNDLHKLVGNFIEEGLLNGGYVQLNDNLLSARPFFMTPKEKDYIKYLSKKLMGPIFHENSSVANVLSNDLSSMLYELMNQIMEHAGLTILPISSINVIKNNDYIIEQIRGFNVDTLLGRQDDLLTLLSETKNSGGLSHIKKVIVLCNSKDIGDFNKDAFTAFNLQCSLVYYENELGVVAYQGINSDKIKVIDDFYFVQSNYKHELLVTELKNVLFPLIKFNTNLISRIEMENKNTYIHILK